MLSCMAVILVLNWDRLINAEAQNNAVCVVISSQSLLVQLSTWSEVRQHAYYIRRRTELNLVNVASVTLLRLLGIPYLTVLSLPLTPIDFKIFLKNSSISLRILTFVSAPGHFVSHNL